MDDHPKLAAADANRLSEVIDQLRRSLNLPTHDLSELERDLLQRYASQVCLTEELAERIAELEAPHATTPIEHEADPEAGIAIMSRTFAHQIKNYLGSARIQLDNVMRGAELSPDHREDLKRVDANMRVCIAITQSLYKPFSPAQRVEANANSLVMKAVEHTEIPSDIEISVSVPEELPMIWIEAESAIDWFKELLANAARAVNEHIEQHQISRGRIEVNGRLSGDGQVELLFTNNGPLIPEEQWDVIFEQFSDFSKGDRRREQLGLGLWGARTFFRRQGGDIFVLGSDEAQTTFMVRLPAA